MNKIFLNLLWSIGAYYLITLIFIVIGFVIGLNDFGLKTVLFITMLEGMVKGGAIVWIFMRR